MRRILCAIALSIALIAPAKADDYLVRRQSKYSMSETLEKIEAGIKEAGATLFARIDLKAAAAKGETLRPHVVFLFGRGGAIQPFLSANSESGIDFPQKILVFEGPNGKIWTVSNKGDYITQRHGIKGLENIETGIDKVIGSIIDKVAN